MKLRICLFLCVLSCFSLLHGQYQHTAKNETFLGTIIQSKVKLPFTKEYTLNGGITITQKTALSSKTIDFTEKSYQRYKQAMRDQGKKVFFEYQDSIAEKPTYLSLKFANTVQLLAALHTTENKSIFEYIVNSDKNKLVTEVAVLVKQPLYDQIINAQKIFLNQNKNGMLELQLQSKEQVQIIPINQLETFSFTTSGFCWKYDDRQLKIVDLVEKGQSCPKDSAKHPRKIKKKKQERYNRF